MSTKEKNPVGITIGINDVKFIHFETTTRVQELKESIHSDGYEFQFDMQTHISEEDKLFNVIMSTTLYEKQNEITKVELANIKTLTSFRIVNFNEVIKKEENQVSIPDQLITVAAGIALSTTRGMLVMCVKDSIISNAIIPIVNPQVFIAKK